MRLRIKVWNEIADHAIFPLLRRRLRMALLMLALATVQTGASAASLSVAGITEPVFDVTLSAAVPGIVSSWKFKEGDLVKENDIIIELDKRLEELEAERRRLVMENRKNDYEATLALFKKSSLSVKKDDMDKAETEYRVAQAEYDTAREQLRRRSIASSFAGHIVEINRRVGEACQPYQPLVRVVNTERFYFIANVEAAAGYTLKTGQTVNVQVSTGRDSVTVPGKISFVSAVIDPASGLLKIKVLCDNAGGKVKPGAAGTMQFETD